MFGLNEYYSELLLEAKTPEEIKQILNYKFVQGNGVPSSVLDAIFDIDPTKKKTYTSWVLNCWKNEKDFILSLLKKNELKRLFEYFKERNNSGLNLTDMGSLQQAYNMLPTVDTVLTKNGNGGPEDNYEIVYDSPEWKIAVPHSYEASEKLGKGCRWCTAGAHGNGEYYYNSYTKYGPLWINFDMRKSEIGPKDNKEYPYTRYQFLFEYKNYYGELMDSDDDRIDFDDLDMPEGVVDFYGDQDENYRRMIEDGPGFDESEEAWNEYHNDRYAERTVLKRDFDHVLSLMEPVNTEHPVMGWADYYLLYDSSDVEDSISREKFRQDCVVNELGDLPCIILKNVDDVEFFAYLEEGEYWTLDNYEPDKTVIDEDEQFVCFFKDYGRTSVLFYKNPFENDSLFQRFKASKPIERIIYKLLEIDGYEPFGVTIELIYKDGFHGLYEIDDYGFNSIIINDKPIGEKFEISKNEEGDEYIQGVYGIHYLESPYGMEYDKNSYDFEAEINDNLYIVSTIGTGYKTFYNIFNKKLNKFLLKEWVNDIKSFKENHNIVILYTKDKAILYNLITNDAKEFSSIWINYDASIFVGHITTGYYSDKSTISSTIFSKNGDVIATFNEVIRILLDNKVLVADVDGFKVFDYTTGVISPKYKIGNVYSIRGRSIRDYDYNYKSRYILFYVEDKVCIYDYIADRIIESGIQNAPYDLKDDLWNECYLLRKKSKVNILIDGKLLFNEYVDNICYKKIYKYFIPFSDNGILRFVNVKTGEIKPKQGFNEENLYLDYMGVSDNGFLLEAIKDKEITQSIHSYYPGTLPYNKESVGYFSYDPETNEIESSVPEVKSYVYQNVVNGTKNISENFIKALNRINSVKF